MAFAFLSTIAQARAVEWGKSFSWDVRFPAPDGPPPPFDAWFPATDCDRIVSQVQTHTFVGFADSFDIPLASGSRTFTVTFGDNDQGVLQDYFTSWIEEKLLGNPGDLSTALGTQGTARLADVVRTCQLARLDARGLIQRVWNLSVFPLGPFNSVRDSNSAMQTHIVTFCVAGVTASVAAP